MGLTMKERQSVTRETAARYAAASRKEKTMILNEFIELTGYNRKYAINLLRSCIRKRRCSRFGNIGKETRKEYFEIIEIVNPTRKKRVYKARYDKPVIQFLFPYLQNGNSNSAWGFSGGLDGKESDFSAGDLGLIPGSGRSLGEGNGRPLQISCLENPMDRGTWLQSMGSQRVGQDRVTNTFTFFPLAEQ